MLLSGHPSWVPISLFAGCSLLFIKCHGSLNRQASWSRGSPGSTALKDRHILPDCVQLIHECFQCLLNRAQPIEFIGLSIEDVKIPRFYSIEEKVIFLHEE